MIRSMTAFARERGESPAGVVVVEVRSVNHRYLDCNLKLPEQLRSLEPKWRELLRSSVARGKIECTARWQPLGGEEESLQVNPEQVQKLAGAVAQVAQLIPDTARINPLDILHWPGVLSARITSDDELQALATRVFSTALSTLAENRQREGTRLAGFISERLQQVAAEVTHTRTRVPEILRQQKVRLQQKLADLQVELDPGRLEQELVFMAQKADVDEELDRLQAHVEEVQRTLSKGGACGRRLDFLMQELNREANTLSSKSISSATTQNAVELKVLIEQMREQIQNLE